MRSDASNKLNSTIAATTFTKKMSDIVQHIPLIK